jgi:tetratricopeptide (TPR) repeat protein
MQRFADAEACYQRSLVMYERLASEHLETYGSDLAMTLNSLANVYYNTQFFTDAEEYCLRSLSIYERLVAANPDIYGYSYAGSLMSAAYYSLFNKKYAQSEEYSREALKWSDDIYIYTNLAAAILLQGRYDEAKQIYWTYRDNLKDSFLEDIQALKDNNAFPSHLNKDVDNIVELLLSDLQ